MSVALKLDPRGFSAARRLLLGMVRMDTHDLLDGVGALVESQTRRRIQSEKKAPDGTPWAPWSERYAATRKGSQSLLQNRGHLLDSITREVHGDEVHVGGNLIYFARHQYGGKSQAPDFMHQRGRGSGYSGGTHEVEVPARPILGLSAENEDEVEAEVNAWLARMVP